MNETHNRGISHKGVVFFCEMKEQAKSFKLFIVCQMRFLHFFCLFSICFIVAFVRLFVYIIDKLCMTSPAVQRWHFGYLLRYVWTRAWSRLGFYWIKYEKILSSLVALILTLPKILFYKSSVSQDMSLLLTLKLNKTSNCYPLEWKFTPLNNF